MLVGMLTALSGLRAASKKLQNSANNIANIQTPGFKKGRIDLISISSGGVRVVKTGNTKSPATIEMLNNVDNTSEVVNQIITKLTFKANAKVIKSTNELIGSILDIKA